MIRCIAILAALLIAAGCSESGSAGGKTRDARATTVSETQAIDIAKGAVAERHGWAATAVYEAIPQGLGWAVTATDDSGGFAMVVIDSDGTVIKVDSRG